ncbi:MAG TPA: gamma-glutamylcyclotransferase family protein [Pelagibacterium sp.]|uniref:gamma-glutamylcyclotransferase family protein n=1 Tax=Pelagibacterium sp. TaxID=1967288 RepID=UPI002B6B1379|nr:gamma-glutamylcyclotransferase family protein [Pelagibacterium sp.]HWJ87625.1 gamma-glutamylcyclotransferase family protein [Pelagibacterium sp.]
MSTESFVTFAYGSNMPAARLRERCPSARAIGIAELTGYELRWHKRSRDGSGKCDIAASAAADVAVFGVLYEIAVHEKRALDRAEGLGVGYEEIEIEVLCGGNPITAKAYRATDTDPALRPYTWYRALVIAGAREHGFPASYVAGLESVPADEDENRSRHDKHMALIEGVQA